MTEKTEKGVATQVINFAVVKFDANDAAIAELKQKFMPLTIKGLDDKEGYEAVHNARMVMVKLRTGIEGQRKGFNEDALRYQKAVNKDAKRLTELAAPIEEHLTAEENKITQEKLRIKQAEEKAAADKLQARINRLQFDLGIKDDGQNFRQAFSPDSPIQGYVMPKALVAPLSDEDFEKLVGEIYKKDLAENDRLVAIETKRRADEAEREKARKAEDERLAKVAKEQAAAQAKIDAENKRIAEENAKLEAEKKAIQEKKDAEAREKVREQELKEAADRATAKAKADAEAKAKADQEEKARIEAEVKAKTERELALRPDRQKILEFITMLETLIMPSTATKEGNAIVVSIADDIGKLAKRVRKQVRELK